MNQNSFQPGCRSTFFVILVGIVFIGLIWLTPESGIRIFGLKLDYDFLLILIPVLFALSKVSRADELVQSQRTRNNNAYLIMQKLKANEPPPEYSLYLRPFATEGKLEISNPKLKFNPLQAESQMDTATIDLERLIAEVVDDDYPLVAIGTREGVGSGKTISSESEWEEDIKLLAEYAARIFVVPFDRPGLRWEFQWIIQAGLLRKAIFIMPPKGSSIDDLPNQLSWQVSRTNFADIGVSLPEYDKHGAIFRLSENGKVEQSFLLNKLSLESLREVIAGHYYDADY